MKEINGGRTFKTGKRKAVKIQSDKICFSDVWMICWDVRFIYQNYMPPPPKGDLLTDWITFSWSNSHNDNLPKTFHHKDIKWRVLFCQTYPNLLRTCLPASYQDFIPFLLKIEKWWLFFIQFLNVPWQDFDETCIS